MMLRFPSGSQQHNSTKRKQQTISHHRQRDNTDPIKHWWQRLRAKLTPDSSNFHGLSPDRPPLPFIEPDSPTSNDDTETKAVIGTNTRQPIAVTKRRAGSSQVSFSICHNYQIPTLGMGMGVLGNGEKTMCGMNKGWEQEIMQGGAMRSGG